RERSTRSPQRTTTQAIPPITDHGVSCQQTTCISQHRLRRTASCAPKRSGTKNALKIQSIKLGDLDCSVRRCPITTISNSRYLQTNTQRRMLLGRTVSLSHRSSQTTFINDDSNTTTTISNADDFNFRAETHPTAPNTFRPRVILTTPISE
ncbi:hypothetical protein QR685DRAFT_303058, partial [Neurospora intermedia]